MKSIFLSPFVLFFFLQSCDILIPEEKVDNTYSRSVIPYNLHEPDQFLPLPHELEEISGLAYYEQGKLAAIDDEDGKVYILSKKGKILNSKSFNTGDDYEGIAIAGNQFYVMKSNGDIFKLSLEIKNPVKFKTPLDHRNDVEGLTFDKQNNRLLIACKDEAGLEEKVSGRAIYSFDLSANDLQQDPLFIVQPEELNQLIKKRTAEFEVTSFAPSAIAIHPSTQQVYIIAHHGKTLAVFDENYALQEVVKLSKKNYKQPEGICFSPDGKKLYISNEGRGGRANILIFNQAE